MKRIKFELLFFLFLLGFSSCQKNEVLEKTNSNGLAIDGKKQSTDKSDALREALIEVGFADSAIIDIGDSYLVGDILFSKDKTNIGFLKRVFNNYSAEIISPMQARTPVVVTPIYLVGSKRIKVTMENSVFSNGWHTAVVEAVNQWSQGTKKDTPLGGFSIIDLGVDATTQYSPTNNYEPTQIRVEGDNGSLPSNVIAAAEFPYYVDAEPPGPGLPTTLQAAQNEYIAPGFRIRINYDFNNSMNVPQNVKLHNMVHEIGHCLGFRHTNWRGLGEPEAIQIPNTPSGNNPDPASVMNGGTALNSWSGLSLYDKRAVDFLYEGTPI